MDFWHKNDLSLIRILIVDLRYKIDIRLIWRLIHRLFAQNRHEINFDVFRKICVIKLT